MNKLSIGEKGPLLILKGLKNRAPDYSVIINRKNIVGAIESSYSDDILHFVHVNVTVPAKAGGNITRNGVTNTLPPSPEHITLIKLDLGSYADVLDVIGFLTKRV